VTSVDVAVTTGVAIAISTSTSTATATDDVRFGVSVPTDDVGGTGVI
jgi:hypothetical protein